MNTTRTLPNNIWQLHTSTLLEGVCGDIRVETFTAPGGEQVMRTAEESDKRDVSSGPPLEIYIILRPEIYISSQEVQMSACIFYMLETYRSVSG